MKKKKWFSPIFNPNRRYFKDPSLKRTLANKEFDPPPFNFSTLNSCLGWWFCTFFWANDQGENLFEIMPPLTRVDIILCMNFSRLITYKFLLLHQRTYEHTPVHRNFDHLHFFQTMTSHSSQSRQFWCQLHFCSSKTVDSRISDIDKFWKSQSPTI